jgi:branched-chain amino acid transport system substrate-binding protein
MIADDIAYGYELNAGFQRAFEDAGGKVVQKLWPPLVSPDYGTYIAQLKQDVDVLFIGFAGSNGFKFFKQYKEYGGKTPILGGMTAIDESLLQQMGDDAIGVISTCWYSAQLDNPDNKTFVEGMNRDYKSIPAFTPPRPIPTAPCSRRRSRRSTAGLRTRMRWRQRCGRATRYQLAAAR